MFLFSVVWDFGWFMFVAKLPDFNSQHLTYKTWDAFNSCSASLNLQLFDPLKKWVAVCVCVHVYLSKHNAKRASEKRCKKTKSQPEKQHLANSNNVIWGKMGEMFLRAPVPIMKSCKAEEQQFNGSQHHKLAGWESNSKTGEQKIVTCFYWQKRKQSGKKLKQQIKTAFYSPGFGSFFQQKVTFLSWFFVIP